jgi:hypothetical protein
MNTTYTLTEGNEALNRVLLMMQYQLGKTLDEQKIPTDKDIKKYQQGEYENATRKYVDNTSTTFKGIDGKQKTTATSPKMLKGIQQMSMENFMEGLREAAYSWSGIAVDIFLTNFGLPEPGIIVFGTLLAYDIKLWIDGKPDYLNLFCDIVGALSGGVGATMKWLPELKKVKSAGVIINSFGDLFRFLSTKMSSFWKLIKPLLKGIGSFIGKLGQMITGGIKWLVSKITPEFIKKMGSSAKEILLWLKNKASSIVSWLNKLVKSILDGIEKITYGTVKKIGSSEKVATSAGKSARGTAAGYGVVTATKPIIEPIIKKRSEGQFNDALNNTPNKQEYEDIMSVK